MEQEEEDVKVSEVVADRVDLGLFEGDSREDEFLFLEPLLEKEVVGRGLRDLVERVHRLRLHY